ncbi:DUF4158 domain-containing protein [Deinococcus wulumuqiensis]|nr:DUF4158 domain-containing protein [Deinococcus wulumuqiensis]
MTIVKTRPALLTTAQRQQFTEFPDPDDQLLARHYTLSDDDLVLIGGRRRNSNRLGFAVQLCVLRHLDKVLDVAEAPPTAVLSFLGEQLGIDPDEYAKYASREPTRREHFLELCQRLGYRSLSLTLNRELRRWLIPLAIVTPQPFPWDGFKCL